HYHITDKQHQNHCQYRPSFVGCDIRNISDPGVVGMRNVEVLLQVIGSNHARTTILITWPASISALGAHMIQTHQPSNSMFTTSFTPIAQVMGHLAVAIDLPTTVPATLDKLNDASILYSACAIWFFTPCIIATMMHF